MTLQRNWFSEKGSSEKKSTNLLRKRQHKQQMQATTLQGSNSTNSTYKLSQHHLNRTTISMARNYISNYFVVDIAIVIDIYIGIDIDKQHWKEPRQSMRPTLKTKIQGRRYESSQPKSNYIYTPKGIRTLALNTSLTWLHNLTSDIFLHSNECLQQAISIQVLTLDHMFILQQKIPCPTKMILL